MEEQAEEEYQDNRGEFQEKGNIQSNQEKLEKYLKLEPQGEVYKNNYE